WLLDSVMHNLAHSRAGGTRSCSGSSSTIPAGISGPLSTNQGVAMTPAAPQRPILLNAFHMMVPVHPSPVLRRHPDSRPDACATRGGGQYPLLDPLSAVSAMAAVTNHLGFGVTASVSYEHPFLLARRLSSLDHLTKGRLAWNIVTSYQDSAARNMGLAQQIPH